MTTRTDDALHVFISGLACRRVARIPSELHEMARTVLRRMRGDAALGGAEDLVSELLCRLLARAGDEACADLLKLERRALRSALAHRMRQIACDVSPGWKAVRALRGHVREVLAAPLPEPTGLPATLTPAGRICEERVRRAVAWLVEQEGLPLCPRRLAARLADLYFDDHEASIDPDSIPSSRSLSADVAIRRDARRLEQDLRARLGGELLRLVLLRRAGAGLQELAGREKVAVSTVHARLQDAYARIRDLARADRLGPETVGLALEQLAA